MNEQLRSLLEDIQRTAGQVGDVAADAAYGVSKKAGELLSVAKLNIRIAELNAEVNTQLRTVGEMIYSTHNGDPTDSDILLAKLQEIDQLRAQIAELEHQLGRERAKVCPFCGTTVRDGDGFCRECGGKL